MSKNGSAKDAFSWRNPLLLLSGACLVVSAICLATSSVVISSVFGVLGMVGVFVWVATRPWRTR